MNEVLDLRLLPDLCKKMLVVPELVGSESLLVNKIVRWINLGYFRCPGACEKRDGRYGVSDYHAGIYFFFCLRCYPQVEPRGGYLGEDCSGWRKNPKLFQSKPAEILFS